MQEEGSNMPINECRGGIAWKNFVIRIRYLSLWLLIVLIVSLGVSIIGAQEAKASTYKGDVVIAWHKPLTAPAKPPNFWSCVVGFSVFKAPYGGLARAAADARDMHARLSKLPGYKAAQTKLFLNPKDGWATVKKHIESVQKTIGANDIFVFYVSTHGFRGGEIAPADEPTKEIKIIRPGFQRKLALDEGIIDNLNVRVPDDRLGELFAGFNGKPNVGVILIFDLCNSGGMVDGSKDPGSTMKNPYAILMGTETEYEAYEFGGGKVGRIDPYAPPKDDDGDGKTDEDGPVAIDNDGDGLFNEDPTKDGVDDDGDGRDGEDPRDGKDINDDGDKDAAGNARVDEDPLGNKGIKVTRHSIFTYYLLQGLGVLAGAKPTTIADRMAGNNDQITTTVELFNYAKDRTKKAAADDDFDGHQDEELPGDGNYDGKLDDDEDGRAEEDMRVDDDRDGERNEDPKGDTDGDGKNDDDGDGAVDEDDITPRQIPEIKTGGQWVLP